MSDKSRVDNNRRNLSLQDTNSVKDILPAHFLEEYPKLISFLETYYEYENSHSSPSHLVNDLFLNRDITAVDIKLLSFIEDELLLGQQYFEGFTNKRSAAKYSNTLYRSKGTLYSIEQFFRTFFSISPDVIYTKKNIFEVGLSEIGPESQKYITDDKLYQKYALLIKAAIPISEWKEAYKLFVHPAGMYIGGEVQIVSENTDDILLMPVPGDLVILDPVIEGVASMTFEPIQDASGIVSDTGSAFGDSDHRISLAATVERYKTLTIAEIDSQYDTVAEFIGVNSPTFDEDSDVGDPRAPRFSSDLDTFDEVKFVWRDSDSA
jgi:hypothetical protein